MKKLLILAILCVIAQGMWAQTTYNYYKCSWDDVNKQVVRTELTASGKIDDISSPKYASGGGLKGEDYDYFVATKSCTIPNGLTVSGTCKLILLDGVTITVIGNGIEVLHGSSLNIYAQSYEGNNIGKLISRPENDRNAAIGSKEPKPYNYYPGGIVINGGIVEAYGGEGAAGIGGGKNGDGGTVVIYDGYVTAQGGEEGAGIGGGYQGNGDHLIVYGGAVKATGGKYGAGIGSGRVFERSARDYKGGKVEIYGGNVTAKGGAYGAGIGGGQDAWGADVIVAGGHVETDGGMDAAGIGSGESVSSSIKAGSLKVTGGYVYADGTGWGAGIGGGEDADGANVEITGGTVVAWAGSDAGEKNGSAIDGYRGSLKIGDKMMVHAGQSEGASNYKLFSSGERVPACFFRPYCRVEVCNHEGHTYTCDDDATHTLHCPHCLIREQEPHETTSTDHVCTKCGGTSNSRQVTFYLPDNTGDNLYAPNSFWVAKDSEITLPNPPEGTDPDGLQFYVWLEDKQVRSPLDMGITSYLWQSGEMNGSWLPLYKYTVTNDVSFTARYQAVSVTLADAADNGAVLYQHDGVKTQKVTLAGRTLYKDGSWNTLCLPFNLTFRGSPLDGDGMEVKTLWASSFDDKGTLTLTFTDVSDEITAGTPFIIRWSNTGQHLTEDDLVFPSVTIHSTPGSIETDYVDFTGIFSPEMIYDAEVKNSLYLGAGNTLYYPDTEGFTIGSCRAYFKLKQGLTAGEATTSQPLGIRAFALDFGDGGLTGIGHITDTMPSGVGSWFTLDGRRLGGRPTTRGLYIHNGKKVVIE